jgi:transketolase
LGADEVKLVKEFFGFDPDKSFDVPEEVLDFYRKKGERGIDLEAKWNKLFADYKAAYPELAEEYETAVKGELPKGWDADLPSFKITDPKVSTRIAGGKALNALAAKVPYLIGGAADLAPSTETNLKNYDSFTSENRAGRNFHFGIREHAMGAALNGMALTAGVIPFGATFLMFSEYMRPPIRLASIMKISPVFIYTHDSIGLGEDGTTHQPVEQLASLRSIPRITVIRPADGNETVEAWKVAVQHKDGPIVMVLTRQNLPIIDQDKYAKASNLAKGAYVLSEASKNPDLILIATGSEVALIMEAQAKLEADGISTRVVSMPSWELFEKQDAAYKESVFPKAYRKRLAVEMASPMGWIKYRTDEGDMLGMETFGESAPADDLYKHFGFTVDNVVKRAKALL